MDDTLTQVMLKAKWPTRIVLVGSRKIQCLDPARIHYHNLKDTHVRQVAIKIGATKEQLECCHNDLRQLQLMTKLNRHNSKNDKVCHIHFDTNAILAGKRLPILDRFYSKLWLAENVLNSSEDLEACARFAATTANTDLFLGHDLATNTVDTHCLNTVAHPQS